jgi:hypothetical protein
MAALGVPTELIRKRTAVSQGVDESMAGALLRTPAGIAIAVTDVAAPIRRRAAIQSGSYTSLWLPGRTTSLAPRYNSHASRRIDLMHALTLWREVLVAHGRRPGGLRRLVKRVRVHKPMLPLAAPLAARRGSIRPAFLPKSVCGSGT